ncbi:unnamed protein product [Agarophyton chilense]|eukprot:gb/GEZJ01004378.1/.p1 GENE.gb/GEZJ01004378.1/~~gb/GEZJ01004378.1/.p1  ORF type:complete len:683 (-),score=75.56 gb/GEZJ01004378.1/:383-2272(-)
MAHNRGSWSSRAAFIVASIGAAIGFGNIWRFPSLAYAYGGGAFFLPYFLALFIIGIPVLILEVAVGQFYQTGDAGAFGKINPRFRGVGLASILAAFVVTTYYCVLVAWTLRMFVYSCQGSETRWRGITGSQAYDWFENIVTGLETVADNLAPTRLVGPNVGALAITWVLIYLCLAFGVKWTGRIAYVTVVLPIAILIVLLVRSLTLDGSGTGVKAYVGEWDFSVLSKEPAVWSEAVSQVFFSLSVTFGIMTAYASYNDRNSPVFANCVIIAISNSIYSIVAGFAVFGTVGYIAQLESNNISDLKIGGPGLIFGTFPVALSTLPGYGHWERLFFVALFLLGIDSAFALAEGVTTVFRDSALLRRFHHAYTTAGVCLAAFLGGLLFCTDSGLLFLDVTDYYVNFMMILVGFMECFAIGWIYAIESQVSVLGWKPVLAYMMATFGSVCLACGLWFGAETKPIMKGFVSLVVCYVLLMAGVLFLCYQVKKNSSNELTWSLIVKELVVGNVLRLREDFVGVVRYIPFLWFVMVRHMLPQLLLVLFANLATKQNDKGRRAFAHYGNYPGAYQAVGLVVFLSACCIIVLGAVFPEAFSCFDRCAAGNIGETVEDKDKAAEEERCENVVDAEGAGGV